MPALLGIRHILFPTDFSEASRRAGEFAAALARQCGARLSVVYVVPPVTDPSPSRGLAAFATEVAPGLPVETEVLSGVPARQILAYARRRGVDLIVMGTHGRTGVSRTLLGSVAEAVVRRAPCPVLTVPAAPAGRAPAEVTEAAEEPGEVSACIVCRKPSPDLICETCRARIRGEALERKLREERPGRG